MTLSAAETVSETALAVADWTSGMGNMQFCVDADEDFMSNMVSGNKDHADNTVETNTACMNAFNYNRVTGDSGTGTAKVCYFCTGNADNDFLIEGFTIPYTTDSLVSLGSLSAISTNADNVQFNTDGVSTSSTPFVGAKLSAACSASFLTGSKKL